MHGNSITFRVIGNFFDIFRKNKFFLCDSHDVANSCNFLSILMQMQLWLIMQLMSYKSLSLVWIFGNVCACEAIHEKGSGWLHILFLDLKKIIVSPFWSNFAKVLIYQFLQFHLQSNLYFIKSHVVKKKKYKSFLY